jgi:hypothetical protein
MAKTIVLSPFSFGHCIISFFIWPLYDLLFHLAIVWSPFCFGHCIISFFFWPLYYLLFLLAIVKTSDPTTCTARKNVGELRRSYIIYICVYVWSFETDWGNLSLDPLREIFFEGLTLLHFLYIFTKVN